MGYEEAYAVLTFDRRPPGFASHTFGIRIWEHSGHRLRYSPGRILADKYRSTGVAVVVHPNRHREGKLASPWLFRKERARHIHIEQRSKRHYGHTVLGRTPFCSAIDCDGNSTTRTPPSMHGHNRTFQDRTAADFTRNRPFTLLSLQGPFCSELYPKTCIRSSHRMPSSQAEKHAHHLLLILLRRLTPPYPQCVWSIGERVRPPATTE